MYLHAHETLIAEFCPVGEWTGGMIAYRQLTLTNGLLITHDTGFNGGCLYFTEC